MLPAGASAPSRLTCPSAQSFTTYRAAVRRRGAGVSPAGPQPGFLVPTDSSSSSSAPVWFSAGPTSPHPGRRTTAAHAAASSGNCITTSSRSTDSSQGTHSPATTGGSSEEVLSSCSSADSFEDEQYEGTVQARERRQWAAQVRGLTGGAHPSQWMAPDRLDPPAVLGRVVVVLVGPKKPATVGSVARSCSCFEVGQMRLVSPRCDPLTRSSRSVSKGAQYVLYQATHHDSVAAALEGASFSVAFTRWVEGAAQALKDLPSLLRTPEVQQVLGGAAASTSLSVAAAAAAASSGDGAGLPQGEVLPGTAGQEASQAAGGHLALVFGREEFGLSDEEVAACNVACSIPIGRLQESLSVAHAVSIVLSQLFQYRQGLADESPRLAGQRPSP